MLHRFIKVLFVAWLCLASLPAWAEGEGKKFHYDINLRGRLGLTSENTDFLFKCDFLRLSIKGTFAENFSFMVRQRFNKAITDGNFLSATDYLYISWRKNGWEVLGGKTYLAVGGFDYLASSYDIYIRPEFFSGLGGMYNYAVQVTRYWEKESICLQVGNSLFSTRASNLLGYSVLLRGRQGCWEHAWSVNAFEREKGKYNFMVCLGNRFHVSERAAIDVGLDHHLDLSRPTFFKDFSAIVKCKVHALDWMNVWGKATWDYKEAGIEDPILPDDTRCWQAGGGFEFYPVKKSKIVRLHCAYYNRNGNLNYVLAGVSLELNFHGPKESAPAREPLGTRE